MQLLYNNSDFESDMENKSNDETYSIGPSSVSSDDEYIDDDSTIKNKEVLGNIFTIEQCCMINLIKLLEDMQCPDTAVTKIIDQARTLMLAGFKFDPISKTCMVIYNG